ncbi:hypothetical protein AYO44_15210 [Planctomycetaceae bacterium SCGC AG-212-F19]|nr:hypothetical protein AYO44_15210 [Planctomycetaceae bacterium SCGC AG-212-F19]
MTSEEIRSLIAERLAPGHFFVKPPATLATEHVAAEELTWEIFHGRLLDAAQTRERRTFESWNVYWVDDAGRSGEPILSVKFDQAANRLYVTRGIHCYAWEAYDEGDNVILSREVKKWGRELVATIDLTKYSELEPLREDLGFRLFQAVIGTSRLPLTSLEAPLPGFTFGEFGYIPTMDGGPNCVRSPLEFLDPIWFELGLEGVKRLELGLRAAYPAELMEIIDRMSSAGMPREMAHLCLFIKLETVFNEVALSPYTDFVQRTILFLYCLEENDPSNPGRNADLFSKILWRLARHLTAFDLVTFHARGANYPDALFLDAVLKALLDLAERQPSLFAGEGSKSWEVSQHRSRLRGLRQGWLFRRRYEGHPVPDTPTSVGENKRVLPTFYPHVSEEQIVDPSCRTRWLFADDPIDKLLTPRARAVLRQSVEDLEDVRELQELGTALFLDRPLGIFKHPTEPDQTVLFSYVAFSFTVANRRLEEMRELGLLDQPRCELLKARLAAIRPAGIPLEMRSVPSRPGVASLQDAFKVASDFVLLRTTRRTVNDFLWQFELKPWFRDAALDFPVKGEGLLIVGGGAVRGQDPTTLTIFDATYHPRLEFRFDPRAGHVIHRCDEYPAGGLHLVRIWEQGPQPGTFVEHDVRPVNIRIGPPDS